MWCSASSFAVGRPRKPVPPCREALTSEELLDIMRAARGDQMTQALTRLGACDLPKALTDSSCVSLLGTGVNQPVVGCARMPHRHLGKRTAPSMRQGDKHVARLSEYQVCMLRVSGLQNVRSSMAGTALGDEASAGAAAAGAPRGRGSSRQRAVAAAAKALEASMRQASCSGGAAASSPYLVVVSHIESIHRLGHLV